VALTAYHCQTARVWARRRFYKSCAESVHRACASPQRLDAPGRVPTRLPERADPGELAKKPNRSSNTMGFVSLLQRVTPAHYAPTDRQTLIYLGVVAGTPIYH